MSEQKIYDIIIIGAGTAGLTAAIYARRGGKSVLILEALSYGGQIINTLDIANYPGAPHISGVDFATTLYNQATDLGAEIEYEKVTKITNGEIKTVHTEDTTYDGRTIIIATGSAERKLGLENEEKLTGRGVSCCATCDGNFFKNKVVAVNGGGNTAFWDALYLSDLCDTVYLIHRRDSFRADAALIEKVKKKPNVHFILNSNITALNADEKGALGSITITNTTDNSTKDLPLSGLFVAIGRIPSTAEFKDVVELDNSGYIKSDEACHTSTPGIFVAGDNRAKPLHQLVTATADGAQAATEAISYLG